MPRVPLARAEWYGSICIMRYAGIAYRDDFVADVLRRINTPTALGNSRPAIATNDHLHAIRRDALERWYRGDPARAAAVGPRGLPPSLMRLALSDWLWLEDRRRALIGTAGGCSGFGDQIMLTGLARELVRHAERVYVRPQWADDIFRGLDRIDVGAPAELAAQRLVWDFYPNAQLQEHILTWAWRSFGVDPEPRCPVPNVAIADDEIERLVNRFNLPRRYIVMTETPEPDTRRPTMGYIAQLVSRVAIPIVHVGAARGTLPYAVDVGGETTPRESIAIVAGSLGAVTGDCWLHHAAAATRRRCLFLTTEVRNISEYAYDTDLIMKTPTRPRCHPCSSVRACREKTNACRDLDVFAAAFHVERIFCHNHLFRRDLQII